MGSIVLAQNLRLDNGAIDTRKSSSTDRVMWPATLSFPLRLGEFSKVPGLFSGCENCKTCLGDFGQISENLTKEKTKQNNNKKTKQEKKTKKVLKELCTFAGRALCLFVRFFIH